MTQRFFIDGVEVPPTRYVLPGTDEGFVSGLNVFETLRTYNGRLFRPEQHAERLLQSCRKFGIDCPSLDGLLTEWTAAIDGLDGKHKVRMALTARHRLTHVSPLDADRVCAPLNVVTRVWEPSPWLDGRIKHGSRAGGELARREANADEVFWVGHDGCLTEATRSSIFAVVDGVVVTPEDDGRILAGVTRAALIEAGRDAGIDVREVPVPRTSAFTELYATSTLKELAPVVQLDGEPAAGDGPLGAAWIDAYRALVDRECPPRA